MTTLKRAIEFCFSPLGIMTILFIGGIVASARRRTSRLGHRMMLAGAVMLLVFVFTPLAEMIVARLERPFPPLRNGAAAVGKARTVVVLSGYGRDIPAWPITNKLSSETLVRTAEGVRIYRERRGLTLIVSGGVLREGDPPVARLMADMAMAMGVPERDIRVEGKSLTTYENLLEVRNIVGADPFVLVTSADSLLRATAVARKLEMKALPAPAAIWAAHDYRAEMPWSDWVWQVAKDLRPSPNRLVRLQAAYHECAGYAWYWMLGRL